MRCARLSPTWAASPRCACRRKASWTIPRFAMLWSRDRKSTRLNSSHSLHDALPIWMTGDEMREIEPHVGGIAALRVPQEGIVDYPKVCDALVARLTERGARVVTGARVEAVRDEEPKR